MSEVLVKLGNGAESSDDLQSSVRLVGNEYLDYLAEHREEIEAALCWDLDKRDIIVSARPEALGIIKWHNYTFEVYPKFLKRLNKNAFSTIANIFFLSNRSSQISPTIIKNALENFGAERSFFDFFFYLILNEVLAFLRRHNRVVLTSESVEVAGVKGSIKTLDSIRQFGGLRHRHICEVQQLEPRLLFLGLIKRFALGILEFSRVEDVRSLAETAVSLLSAVEPVELNRENIRKLKSMSALLISETRTARPIIQNIVGLSEASILKPGIFGHSSFALNLNYHYEDLVFRILTLYAEHKDWAIKSGNTRPLDLLDNVLNGVAAVENEIEDCAPVRSITIKPDIYIQNRNQVVLIADAKYKVLETDGTGFFSGVSSKDIQQVLAYWLHFLDRADKHHPQLCLIYPEVATSRGDKLVRPIGSVVLRDPSGIAGSLEIQVLMISLETTIPVLLDESGDKDAIRRRIAEEIDAAFSRAQRSQ